jgi:hypothetical protein
VNPLSIHELFDFIDALWRVLHPKGRLLRMSSLATGYRLGSPCDDDRDQFEAKLSALGEVFNSLAVDPALSGPGPSDNGPLRRMRAVLLERARVSQMDEAQRDQLAEAFEVLAQALSLRAGAQHADAKGRLPRAAEAFGLTLPAPSYSEAWSRVCGRLSEALRTIRDCMREIVSAEDRG